MLRFAVGVPLSLYVGETYNKPIYDNYIRQYALDQVGKKLTNSQEITNFTNQLKDSINTFSFLLEDKADLDMLNNLTSDKAAVYITDNIIEPVAVEIVKLVLILLTFLLFYVITGIIVSTAKKIREKKDLPLHHTNSILGGVFGLVKAFIIVIVIGAVADLIVTLDGGENEFLRQLESSTILKYVNEYNPILTLKN
ncbi:MAG: CvpA family protein [Eubacteriales bacterium]|nr:CvpA family protein [Eubacteriales bacterium]